MDDWVNGWMDDWVTGCLTYLQVSWESIAHNKQIYVQVSWG